MNGASINQQPDPFSLGTGLPPFSIEQPSSLSISPPPPPKLNLGKSSPGADLRAPSNLLNQSKRLTPLVDLIDTEQQYVDQLTGIIRRVAAAWSRTNLPPPDLDTMFRSIEGVYKANRGLYSKLKVISIEPVSPRAIGELLMNWVEDLRTPYITYCTRYCVGFDTWEPVLSNPKLARLLKDFSTSCPPSPTLESPSWTLDALFLLPKIRLNYYKKLYSRLVKATEPNRRDFRLLVGAVDRLEVFIEAIESRSLIRPRVQAARPQLPSAETSYSIVARPGGLPPVLPPLESKVGLQWTFGNHMDSKPGGSDSGNERLSQEITVAADRNISPPVGDKPADTPLGGEKHLKITMLLLSAILRASHFRKALINLQGNRGQLMVDYLHSLLLEPSLPMPWLRKHSLIALRDLSKTSLLYPHCYALKDIIFDSHESGGAFSDVHKGRYGEQLLCLKVVRLHQKSDTEAMLRIYAKEAILWGQLNHPNIAPFYGIYYLNEARRQVCLVSPWMRNGNLVDYLRNNHSAPRSLLIYDVAAGLEYLHSQSLVHSDIKGMNILVDDSERACITDFGLSFVRTDQTLAYTLAATTAQGLSYRWAAPELLEDGVRATLASDVWALGCVFYEVLTGLLPFRGSTDLQITRKLMNGASPAGNIPVSSSDSVENAMWGLISRCWTRDPSGRPTCQVVLNELKERGLAREQEEIFEDVQKTRNFQCAMRKNEEVPLDLNAVETILNELAWRRT